MIVKRRIRWHLWLIAVLVIASSLTAACQAAETNAPVLPEIQTQLLVRAPDGSLPLNKSIEVRSRTDADSGVAHVDLYVTLPSNEEVLVYSDAAAFQQKSFTASQTFTPRQPGHYVIKVIGYNQLGQNASSNSIGFEVQ